MLETGAVSRRGERPELVPAALRFIFLLLLVGTVATLGSAQATRGVSGGPGIVTLSSPFAATTCSTLNSNVSLNGTIEEIYRGLPNVSQTWSPSSNSSMPTNESGYPTQTAADAELIGAWASICASPIYVALLGEWGTNNVTGGLALNGSTGHYQVNFGVYWHAACANPANNADGYCQHSTTWYVDLVTGQVDGPITTEWAGPPTGWGPPPFQGDPTQSPASGAGGGWFSQLPSAEGWVLVAGLGAAAVATLLCATLLYRRRKRP